MPHKTPSQDKIIKYLKKRGRVKQSELKDFLGHRNRMAIVPTRTSMTKDHYDKTGQLLRKKLVRAEFEGLDIYWSLL